MNQRHQFFRSNKGPFGRALGLPRRRLLQEPIQTVCKKWLPSWRRRCFGLGEPEPKKKKLTSPGSTSALASRAPPLSRVFRRRAPCIPALAACLAHPCPAAPRSASSRPPRPASSPSPPLCRPHRRLPSLSPTSINSPDVVEVALGAGRHQWRLDPADPKRRKLFPWRIQSGTAISGWGCAMATLWPLPRRPKVVCALATPLPWPPPAPSGWRRTLTPWPPPGMPGWGGHAAALDHHFDT